MRKHGGPPSRRDKHVTLAAISPPGVARGRFVGGQQSGLAGCKPPPLFTRGASSCSSQGRRQGEPWGASPRPSAPTYLPTSCGVLGHLAPVHRCARSVCCVACAVSWATWLLFSGASARCVTLLLRCSGALDSCSPVFLLIMLCCVCGVLGHLAPLHRSARSVRCFACAVSSTT